MKISYNEINNECNELHDLAMRINENVNSLRTLSDSLNKNGIYLGSASDYYNKKLQQLLKNFDDITLEIENSILFLAKSAEGYASIDNMIMNQICNNLNILEPNLNTSKIFY